MKRHGLCKAPAERACIPVFFAVDDRYAPCLSVALRSLGENASQRYCYRIHILISTLKEETMAALRTLERENLSIEFVSVKDRLDRISGMLHLRDYYSKATYYRFFVPELFPEYERGIYLDCDMVVQGDISRLYRTNLGDCLLAAVHEDVMDREEPFFQYVEEVLDMPCRDYFNAGMLLMNLKEMRRFALEARFVELLGKRTFRLTQDQDYLNVLTYGRTVLLDRSWNVTSFPEAPAYITPNIVHYKIHWKPWHFSGVRFEELFWRYAKDTPYAAELEQTLRTYSAEEQARDEEGYRSIIALARQEVEAARQQRSAEEAQGLFASLPDLA